MNLDLTAYQRPMTELFHVSIQHHQSGQTSFCNVFVYSDYILRNNFRHR